METASEISFARPASCESRLDVRIKNPKYYREFVYLFGFFFMLSIIGLAGLIFIPAYMPHYSDFKLFKLICAPLGLGAIFIFTLRKYKQAKAKPIVLEAFDNGLWFNWENLFLPYDRLKTLHITRSNVRGNGLISASLRFAVFTFRLNPPELSLINKKSSRTRSLDSAAHTLKIALPGQDGAMTPSFQDIVDRVKTLVQMYNGSIAAKDAQFIIDP